MIPQVSAVSASQTFQTPTKSHSQKAGFYGYRAGQKPEKRDCPA